jgi:hypothetical protein
MDHGPVEQLQVEDEIFLSGSEGLIIIVVSLRVHP